MDLLYELGERFSKQIYGENSEQYRKMVEGRISNKATGRNAQKEIYSNRKAEMEVPIRELQD